MISTEEPWLYRVFSPIQLVAGRFGVLEPDFGQPMIETDQKSLVVFVPGVVFDCCGNRLGRGDGWYDRLLARLRGIFIGLAYEFQLVERLAAEKWDRKVQYIITEKRVIDCGI
jgi:5-formyltetrahydrofolate cyclo-ligase